MHKRNTTPMMNKTTIALALLSAFQLLSAQERLSREEALKYAMTVSADARQLKSTPISLDIDSQQPVAIRDGDYGGMVLPQKKLAATSLARAEKETITPIGQLWLHKLTLMRDGQAVSSEKLCLVTVQAEGTEARVPQCALGARRNTDGALELVIFGKEKDPLLAVPLKTIDARQEAPIDLAAERESYSGRITIKILGKYEGTFEVTELEP
jgi:hypothetical protein